MAIHVGRVSRVVAVFGLLAAAMFFGWYGLMVGASWPAALPFFGACALAWVLAAVGVSRETSWGPSFATGLSLLTVALMMPAVSRPAVGMLVGGQLATLFALGLATSLETPNGSWRHSALGFGAGLAVPWLIVVGFMPHSGTAHLTSFAAFAVAATGLMGALRGRTWGVLAMVASMPILLAIPPQSWGCGLAPHDAAGEIAAASLGVGALAWIGPIARFLRAKA